MFARSGLAGWQSVAGFIIGQSPVRRERGNYIKGKGIVGGFWGPRFEIQESRHKQFEASEQQLSKKNFSGMRAG